MTTETKVYSNYEELKLDYIQVAQKFEFLCLEINDVIDEIDENVNLTVDDVYSLLNDKKEKIAKSYLEYQALANKSLDMLNDELKSLENQPISEYYDHLVQIHEEKDQINKEIDYLNEYYDDANNLISSYLKKYEDSLNHNFELE